MRTTTHRTVVWAILLIFALAGCQQDPAAEVGADGGSAPAADAAPIAPSAATAPTTGAVNGDDALGPLSVKDVVRPDALAEDLGLNLDAGAVMALQWTDTNGANVAVLSRDDAAVQSGTIHLFADHYVLSDADAPRRLRHLQDGVDDCVQDEFADFLYGAFRVTDADHDGYGEVTLAYEYTCAGDVGPFELKAAVLEDGEKYIVRGTTWSSREVRDAIGGDVLPDGTPDPPAGQWPEALWQQTRDVYAEAAIR